MGVAISYCYYFEPHVRVDLVQCVPGCLHLAQLGLLQLEETVHVSHLHLVIVKQQQLGEGGEEGRGRGGAQQGLQSVTQLKKC